VPQTRFRVLATCLRQDHILSNWQWNMTSKAGAKAKLGGSYVVRFRDEKMDSGWFVGYREHKPGNLGPGKKTILIGTHHSLPETIVPKMMFVFRKHTTGR